MSLCCSRTALVGALLVAACAQGADAPEQATPAGPNMVTVMMSEYAFDMPDTIPAGLTTLRAMDHGKEFHFVQLIRLDDGKTASDFMANMGEEGPPPAWATPVGGVAPPPPGGTLEATLSLEPGTYLAVCFIQAPDGVPHVAKGMLKQITVVPDETPRSAPEADIILTMKEYGWDISAPLTAGPHTFRVENAGVQPHETILIRLNEGVTLDEFFQWVQSPERGEAPGEPMGGNMTVSAGGGPVWFSADLTPGNYAFVCFVNDSEDGRPHFMHGMVHEFSIEG